MQNENFAEQPHRRAQATTGLVNTFRRFVRNAYVTVFDNTVNAFFSIFYATSRMVGGPAVAEMMFIWLGFQLTYIVCMIWALTRKNWVAGFFGLIYITVSNIIYWGSLFCLFVTISSLVYALIPYGPFSSFLACFLIWMIALKHLYERWIKHVMLAVAGIMIATTFCDVLNWVFTWFILKHKAKAGSNDFVPHGIAADYVDFCAEHQRNIGRFRIILALASKLLTTLFDLLDPTSNPLFDFADSRHFVKRPNRYKDSQKRHYYGDYEPHGKPKDPKAREAWHQRRKERKELKKTLQEALNDPSFMQGDVKKETPVLDPELAADLASNLVQAEQDTPKDEVTKVYDELLSDAVRAPRSDLVSSLIDPELHEPVQDEEVQLEDKFAEHLEFLRQVEVSQEVDQDSSTFVEETFHLDYGCTKYEEYGFSYVYLSDHHHYALIVSKPIAKYAELVSWMKKNNIIYSPLHNDFGFKITKLNPEYKFEKIKGNGTRIAEESTPKKLKEMLRVKCQYDGSNDPVEDQLWMFSRRWVKDKQIEARIKAWVDYTVPAYDAISQIIRAEAIRRLNDSLSLPGSLRSQKDVTDQNRAIRDYFLDRDYIAPLSGAFDSKDAVIAMSRGKVYVLKHTRKLINGRITSYGVALKERVYFAPRIEIVDTKLIASRDPAKFKGERKMFFDTEHKPIFERAYHVLRSIGGEKNLSADQYAILLPKSHIEFNEQTKPEKEKTLFDKVWSKFDCMCGLVKKHYRFPYSNYFYPFAGIIVIAVGCYFLYFMFCNQPNVEYEGHGKKGKTKGRALGGHHKKAKYESKSRAPRKTREQYIEEYYKLVEEQIKFDNDYLHARYSGDHMALYFEEMADYYEDKARELYAYIEDNWGFEEHGLVTPLDKAKEELRKKFTTTLPSHTRSQTPIKKSDIIEKNETAKITNPNFNSILVTGEEIGRGVVVKSSKSPTGKVLIVNRHVIKNSPTLTIVNTVRHQNNGKRKFLNEKFTVDATKPIATSADVVAIPIDTPHRISVLPWIPNEKLENLTKVGLRVRNTVMKSELISNHTGLPFNTLNVHFDHGDSGTPALKTAENGTPIAYVGIYCGAKDGKGVVYTPTQQFLQDAGMAVQTLN